MKKISLAARASIQPYFSSRHFRAASNQTERLEQAKPFRSHCTGLYKFQAVVK